MKQTINMIAYSFCKVNILFNDDQNNNSINEKYLQMEQFVKIYGISIENK